jgi:hypothetical protein
MPCKKFGLLESRVYISKAGELMMINQKGEW